MDGLIDKYSAIMDKYDPEKKVALGRGRMGRLVRAVPGQQSRVPGPAEQSCATPSWPR